MRGWDDTLMSSVEDQAEATRKAGEWLRMVQALVAAPRSEREINARPLES